MINNKGPSIEPCGTPTVIGRMSDLVLCLHVCVCVCVRVNDRHNEMSGTVMFWAPP